MIFVSEIISITRFEKIKFVRFIFTRIASIFCPKTFIFFLFFLGEGNCSPWATIPPPSPCTYDWNFRFFQIYEEHICFTFLKHEIFRQILKSFADSASNFWWCLKFEREMFCSITPIACFNLDTFRSSN